MVLSVQNTAEHLSYYATRWPGFFSFGRHAVVRILRRPLTRPPAPVSGFRVGQAAFYARIFGSKRPGINTKNGPICPDSGDGVPTTFQGPGRPPPGPPTPAEVEAAGICRRMPEKPTGPSAVRCKANTAAAAILRRPESTVRLLVPPDVVFGWQSAVLQRIRGGGVRNVSPVRTATSVGKRRIVRNKPRVSKNSPPKTSNPKQWGR